jgi:hypothetical protein
MHQNKASLAVIANKAKSRKTKAQSFFEPKAERQSAKLW